METIDYHAKLCPFMQNFSTKPLHFHTITNVMNLIFPTLLYILISTVASTFDHFPTAYHLVTIPMTLLHIAQHSLLCIWPTVIPEIRDVRLLSLILCILAPSTTPIYTLGGWGEWL